MKTAQIIFLLFLIGVLIGIAGYLGWSFGNKPGWYMNTNRAAVVKEMRQLNRLETASFTLEQIIDAGTNEENAIKQFLFGDKILLIANGQVIAGIDMAKLDEKNVEINGQILKLTLPPPQILVTKLDSEKTRVYDRKFGLFTKGSKDLEAEARQQAEASIKKAACDAGILKTASDNAKRQLTALFNAFQFTSVTIIIPEGKCE